MSSISDSFFAHLFQVLRVFNIHDLKQIYKVITEICKIALFSGVIMDNEKCLEMFQNIKKQISDQGVFNLTGTFILVT